MWIEDLIRRFGEALIPVKRINAPNLFAALRHPLKYKSLAIDEKQCVMIWLDKGKVNIIGGVDFSNVVFNPEIGKGWITNDDGSYDFNGKKCYIVDSKIPHVLTVNKHDVQAQYRVSDSIKTMLGLPKRWVQLQVDMLNNMALNKWNQGFDEQRGSVMIFLFGFFGGSAVGVFLTLVMIVILGAALK